MTNFVKASFEISGDYVHYTHEGQRHFIARFKYQKKFRQSFLNFLVKNMTVETYLDEMKNPASAPFRIAEAHGWDAIRKAVEAL